MLFSHKTSDVSTFKFFFFFKKKFVVRSFTADRSLLRFLQCCALKHMHKNWVKFESAFIPSSRACFMFHVRCVFIWFVQDLHSLLLLRFLRLSDQRVLLFARQFHLPRLWWTVQLRWGRWHPDREWTAHMFRQDFHPHKVRLHPKKGILIATGKFESSKKFEIRRSVEFLSAILRSQENLSL